MNGIDLSLLIQFINKWFYIVMYLYKQLMNDGIREYQHINALVPIHLTHTHIQLSWFLNK